jgi:protein-S-isoprenylcysteine O-methyltransferase Ste14
MNLVAIADKVEHDSPGLYLSLYVIPCEEAYMERVFGEEYSAYCRRVRRWLYHGRKNH